MRGMQTNIHEIADGVYRLSTVVPEVAPGGFTFNQYLIDGDEPMLFHTGARQLFPLVSEAVAKVIDVERAALDQLRPRRVRRVRLDEPVARPPRPNAEVVFNPLGCMVSLNDLCDRPPRRRSTPTSRHDIGGHAMRMHPDAARAPRLGGAGALRRDHPHAVLRRPLHARSATARRIVHDADLIQPALDAEDMFGATALTADHRADAPPARRPRAPYAGAHARPRLRRRLPPGAARPGRRLRGPLHRLARARRWRLMRQELTTDTVERYIEASPEALYDLIADVTRTPERTPDIVRCEWLDGATGPAVGARFKAINKQGRGPELEQQAGGHRRRPGPGVRLRPHRALRRHHRVALPVRSPRAPAPG